MTRMIFYASFWVHILLNCVSASRGCLQVEHSEGSPNGVEVSKFLVYDNNPRRSTGLAVQTKAYYIQYYSEYSGRCGVVLAGARFHL